MVQTKNVEISDPARPATLEGATSFCPQAALHRIAQDSDTPLEALSTLTVKTAAAPLYNAILAYAAEGSVPMLVRYVEEDKDEDENPMKILERYRGEPRPTSGSGLKHKHAPTPVIELGTSECSVLWPPTKGDMIWTKAGYEMNGVANDDGEKKGQFRVYIVHYSIGDPKGLDCSVRSYEEITLVCVDKENLIRFTYDVMEWHHQMKQIDTRGKSFALHRFKIRYNRGWWEAEGMKRARKAESVVLPQGQLGTILDDVEHFMSVESREWYIEHGLPHRRSYLFYGPPGTGKTSTIRVIAGRFGLNCCYLSMVNKDFSNQFLADALAQVPANALIVLEDVDALFKERKSEDKSELTFSGLLNSLDGLISADGVIVVMTTNHLEHLDQALIRGGRVDRRFYFPRPDDEQIANVFKAYYPNVEDKLVEEFLGKVTKREEKEARFISTLQQLFIEMRGKDARACVDDVDGFFERHFPKVLEGQ